MGGYPFPLEVLVLVLYLIVLLHNIISYEDQYAIIILN